MKLLIVGSAYALWLVVINLVFYLTRGHDLTAQEYSVLLGIVPMLFQLLLLGFDPAGMARPAKVMGAFLLIVLMSYLFNGADWNAVTYVVELLYLSAVTMLIAGCPDRRLLRRIAQFYSVPSALFLLYIDAHGKYLWGRLVEGNLESNVWGLLGLTVGVTAFAHRSRLLLAFCLAAGFATINAASSRSSLVGLTLAISLVATRYVFGLRGRPLVVAFGAVAAVLALIASCIPSVQSAVMEVLDDLLKIDDPLRGLHSGATGREELWKAAIDLWWNHPVFGVGYRMHEAFLPLNFSSHNAYLAMLADTGLFGFLWYMALMIAAWVGMFRLGDPATRNLAIGVVGSYALIGLFERRAINGGNPMSLLFLATALFILRERAVARIERLEEWRRAWVLPPIRPVPETARARG